MKLTLLAHVPQLAAAAHCADQVCSAAAHTPHDHSFGATIGDQLYSVRLLCAACPCSDRLSALRATVIEIEVEQLILFRSFGRSMGCPTAAKPCTSRYTSLSDYTLVL